MKLNIKEIAILFGIVIAAFLLRFWQYFYFPVGGETADESAWTLLGASLIQERVPTSWSYFLAYENYHYVEGVFDAPIVRPVLDHPPLFSLLPGTAHSLKSHWLDSPSFKVIRLPMVLLGALNVGIFWLLVRRIFASKEWAALATGLFMTIPEIVFGSRLVVAENLLVTWIMLALLVSLSKPGRWTVKLLVLISAAAVLTKIAGLIVPISLLLYGLLTKQSKITRSGIIGGVLGLSLFALYGALYNWPLFTAVVSAQSARELGLATLQNRLFLNPVLVKHIFFDGWKLLGLFAAVFLLGKNSGDKKFLLVSVFTIVSLLFIALTTGETTFHGWYDFVLWPSLAISITALIREIIKTKNGLLFGVLWLLLLPVIRLALIFGNEYQALSNVALRGIIAAGFLPLLWQLLNKERLMKITITALLLILVFCNVSIVLNVNHEAYWLQAAFFELPQ